jgi:hypothetical protein
MTKAARRHRLPTASAVILAASIILTGAAPAYSVDGAMWPHLSDEMREGYALSFIDSMTSTIRAISPGPQGVLLLGCFGRTLPNPEALIEVVDRVYQENPEMKVSNPSQVGFGYFLASCMKRRGGELFP